MERKKKWEEKRDAAESDLEYMLYDDMANQNPPPELPKPNLLELDDCDIEEVCRMRSAEEENPVGPP